MESAHNKPSFIETNPRVSEGLDILIVDDEPYIRELLAELLSEHDHRSDTAENGEEALKKLQQKHFHVILTDIKMPRMDGFSLLRKARPLYPDSAFVVMTGFDRAYSAREALSLGAEEYLSKPFHTEQVLNAVEQAYRRNRSRRRNGHSIN
jgi:YesN/AraC family two-component response regulator